MTTKVKLTYYHSFRDGLTHVDVYTSPDGKMMVWTGHLCMPKMQWSALGGLMSAGDQASTACDLTIEKVNKREEV